MNDAMIFKTMIMQVLKDPSSMMLVNLNLYHNDVSKEFGDWIKPQMEAGKVPNDAEAFEWISARLSLGLHTSQFQDPMEGLRAMNKAIVASGLGLPSNKLIVH